MTTESQAVRELRKSANRLGVCKLSLNIESVLAELAACQAERDELRKTLTDLENLFTKLCDERDGLKTKVKILGDYGESVTAELETAQARLLRFKEDIAKAADDYTRVMAERNAAQAAAAEMRDALGSALSHLHSVMELADQAHCKALNVWNKYPSGKK